MPTVTRGSFKALVSSLSRAYTPTDTESLRCPYICMFGGTYNLPISLSVRTMTPQEIRTGPINLYVSTPPYTFLLLTLLY